MTSYFAETRSNMAPFLPSRYSRVLEIGCAEGGFRQNLTMPCEYIGVEPSPVAARIAATRLDTVHTGIYEQVAAKLPDNHFDLIICNDVIEHMVDHESFLAHIQTKLAPGGVIVGSIPNMRYILAFAKLVLFRDWPYAQSGVLDRTHLRFFTQKSLSRALTNSGYVIETMAGINPIWSLQSGRALVTRVAPLLPLMLLLGMDTRFQQFAFRVRPQPPM